MHCLLGEFKVSRIPLLAPSVFREIREYPIWFIRVPTHGVSEQINHLAVAGIDKGDGYDTGSVPISQLELIMKIVPETNLLDGHGDPTKVRVKQIDGSVSPVGLEDDMGDSSMTQKLAFPQDVRILHNAQTRSSPGR